MQIHGLMAFMNMKFTLFIAMLALEQKRHYDHISYKFQDAPLTVFMFQVRDDCKNHGCFTFAIN